MQRLATALIIVPVVLAGLFLLDNRWFFLGALAVFELAAWELATIGRTWAPRAPLGALPVLVALASLASAPPTLFVRPLPEGAWMALALLLTAGIGSLVLLRRTPAAESPTALGLLAFGTLYLGLPVGALARVQAVDPWLVFVLFAIVWLGDSAALVVGRRWGRRPLAPRVSPKKTWEGAAACLATALGCAVVGGLAREGRVDAAWVILAALTSLAAQLGDLVESLFKRAAGLKDSGSSLPGHGGWLDRLDAMVFAAPVWWLGLAVLGRLAPR